MSFFHNQIQAKRNSKLLVAYFVMAVVLIVLAVYLAVVICFIGAGGQAPDVFSNTTSSRTSWWQPELFAGVCFVVLAVIGFGSLYKILALRGGGAHVAESLGGRLLDPSTTDPAEKQLLNVVEEVAIASGVAVPPTYLLEDHSINAFAAGYKPQDAVIGVTRGCMQLLNRNEIQGVIAHEFSHILNGDMRLNIRLIGLLHGILIIGLTGYWLLRSSGGSRHRSRNNKNEGGGIVIFALALLVIGYVGVFFGKLIKAAVSRQREFLADASAVQFTRYPDGIGGALKKIGGLAEGSFVSDSHAEEVSHMFFANGVKQVFLNALSTHPPLRERIKRIDKNFDGTFPKIEFPEAKIQEQPRGRDVDTGHGVGPFGIPIPGIGIPGVARLSDSAMPTKYQVSPETVVAGVGTPTAEHLEYARRLIASIPSVVSEHAHHAHGARAVVYFLLFDSSESIRSVQLKYLEGHESNDVLHIIDRLQSSCGMLPVQYRLPIIDMCIPSLKMLSASQYASFREHLKFLSSADNHCSLFEYALHHILSRSMNHLFGGSRKIRGGYSKDKILKAAEDLMDVVAKAGHTELGERIAAFDTAMEVLGISKRHDFQEAGEPSLELFDSSLGYLEHADFSIKEKIIEAATACIASDQVVRVEEAELLRTIGDALDCPVPPFLPGQAV